MLVNQEGHDVRITDLAGVVNGAFGIVHDSDYSKTVETNGKSVTLLIQEVMECGYFVAQFIRRKNFCELKLCLLSSKLITI